MSVLIIGASPVGAQSSLAPPVAPVSPPIATILPTVDPAATIVPATSGKALTAISAPILLKAGTKLLIKTSVSLSSKLNRPGDRFGISMLTATTDNGQVLVLAGAGGEGEIIHTAKARWGGKPGELIANARFLQCGSVRLPVGHLHWSRGGDNLLGAAIAASMLFSPAMFLVTGGEVEIPAGTAGEVSLLNDVTIPRSLAATCVPAVTAVPAPAVAAAPAPAVVPAR